jgi:hypothetical protein
MAARVGSKRVILLSDDDEDEPSAPAPPPPPQAAPAQRKIETSPLDPKPKISSSSNSKAKQRAKAVEEMAQRLGKGLQALESSGSEYSNSDSDSDSGSASGSDDSDEEDTAGDRSAVKDVRKQQYGLEDAWEFSASVNAQRKGTSSSSSSRKRSIQQPTGARFCKDKSEREDSDNSAYEDVDDFIVGSDEEREEAEAEARAAAKRKAKEKAARRQRREARRQQEEENEERAEDEDEEEDEDDEPLSARKTPQKRETKARRAAAAGLTDSNGKPVKRIVIDDDDEDENENEDEDERQGGKEDSSEEEDDRRERKRRRHSSRSKKPSAASASSSSEEEEEEEEEDSSDDEGGANYDPSLYWQVDAMREEEDAVGSSSLQLRQSFSPEEAMAAYVELLARAHLRPEFIREILEKKKQPANARLLSAARQLENKMCTMRESLLASGAWSGGGSEFARELSCRPFYITGARVDMLKDSGCDERCAACNRVSKTAAPIHVYLFGQPYDAKEVWMSQTWDTLVPKSVFVHTERGNAQAQAQKARRREAGVHAGGREEEVVELGSSSEGDSSSAGDEDDDEEEDEEDRETHARTAWWARKWPGKLTAGKESRWLLSGHCKHRTQLYHSMLHYKMRLLLKIRERLEVHHFSVQELLNDQAFINHEVSRYESLQDLATSQFGGKGMEDRLERGLNSLWGEDEGGGGSGGGRRKGKAAGASADIGSFGDGAGAKHQSQMLNWLKKKDQL